jgi:hypothetical protein
MNSHPVSLPECGAAANGRSRSAIKTVVCAALWLLTSACGGGGGGGGDGNTSTDSTTTQQTATGAAASPPVIATLSLTDAYLGADPRGRYRDNRQMRVQTMDTAIEMADIDEQIGIPGNERDGLTNFETVTDPDDISKKAFRFRVAQRDPGGDGKRTELAWSKEVGYSVGLVYWQAFRIRIGGRINEASSQDEVIVWQIHHDDSPSLNPNMSLVARGGGAGASLDLIVRQTSGSPSSRQNNIASRTVYTEVGYPSERWITFVMQFRLHHTDGNGAFLKVWRDGAMVVNDGSPNDYNFGQERDLTRRAYQKLGIYHYFDDQWGPSDSYEVYHKGVVAFVDDGTITEAAMRNLIESR